MEEHKALTDTGPTPTDPRTHLPLQDLVVNPEPTLRAVCEMIGIEWDGQMLNPYASETVAKLKKAETVAIHCFDRLDQALMSLDQALVSLDQALVSLDQAPSRA